MAKDKAKDLARMVKQATETAEYWETRYRTLARALRAYFGARAALVDERKRLVEEVTEVD